MPAGMRGSRKFCQMGSNSDNGFFYFLFSFLFFFSYNEGERIQIPIKMGHHRHASEMPFKWRFAGVPIMSQLAGR